MIFSNIIFFHCLIQYSAAKHKVDSRLFTFSVLVGKMTMSKGSVGTKEKEKKRENKHITPKWMKNPFPFLIVSTLLPFEIASFQSMITCVQCTHWMRDMCISVFFHTQLRCSSFLPFLSLSSLSDSFSVHSISQLFLLFARKVVEGNSFKVMFLMNDLVCK